MVASLSILFAYYNIMIDNYLSNYQAEAQLVRHGWNGSSVMSKHLKPVIDVRDKIYSP